MSRRLSSTNLADSDISFKCAQTSLIFSKLILDCPKLPPRSDQLQRVLNKFSLI